MRVSKHPITLRVEEEEVWGYRNLTEVGQFTPDRFAFLKEVKDTSGHYKPLHPLIKCREFTNDMYHAEEVGSCVLIYGHEWKPYHKYATHVAWIIQGVPELDLDLTILNRVERTLGITKTILHRNVTVTGVSSPTDIWNPEVSTTVVLEFASEWKHTPYLLHLFTGLVRDCVAASIVKLDEPSDITQRAAQYVPVHKILTKRVYKFLRATLATPIPLNCHWFTACPGIGPCMYHGSWGIKQILHLWAGLINPGSPNFIPTIDGRLKWMYRVNSTIYKQKRQRAQN